MPIKTETNLTERWKAGTPHHKESVSLYKMIEAADWKLNSDYFCFKSGGDGDNGEHLMYLLDVIFEARDNSETKQLLQLIGLNDRV